ncbi:MAG: glycosyltransferase [Flavobacteriaceae bacterium]
MKVLFVSSGNIRGLVPFIESQGESIKEEGVDLDYYLVYGRGVRGYLKNIKLIRKQIIENKYDVVHAHYGLIGLLCALAFTKKPIVLSIMGSDAYGNFNEKGERLKKSYIDMLLTQIAIFFAKHIIVKSENLLKYIPKRKKCDIVPNGVNFEIFAPDSNTLVNSNSILFLANENDSRKNYALLKESVKYIKSEKVNVINPYPISHSEFPYYLNKCSVFVLTSYQEGSPNVIKEAMACNIPIVSTNVGDVEKIIMNTQGCYLTSFDPKEVAEKIDKAILFNKRTTGRNDIKHLNSKLVAKKIIEIYKSVNR